MSIGESAALIGAITGPVGLLIALLVYFRDRAVARVSLQWDMEIVGDGCDREKGYLVVTVRNVGRRSIYLSHAYVNAPHRPPLVLMDSVQGFTLAEGAPPKVMPADQAIMANHADRWWKLRATVIDAAGKQYHSDWTTKAPSWADNVNPPFGAISWNKLRNWARRRVPWPA